MIIPFSNQYLCLMRSNDNFSTFSILNKSKEQPFVLKASTLLIDNNVRDVMRNLQWQQMETHALWLPELA